MITPHRILRYPSAQLCMQFCKCLFQILSHLICLYSARTSVCPWHTEIRTRSTSVTVWYICWQWLFFFFHEKKLCEKLRAVWQCTSGWTQLQKWLSPVVQTGVPKSWIQGGIKTYTSTGWGPASWKAALHRRTSWGVSNEDQLKHEPAVCPRGKGCRQPPMLH